MFGGVRGDESRWDWEAAWCIADEASNPRVLQTWKLCLAAGVSSNDVRRKQETEVVTTYRPPFFFFFLNQRTKK